MAASDNTDVTWDVNGLFISENNDAVLPDAFESHVKASIVKDIMKQESNLKDQKKEEEELDLGRRKEYQFVYHDNIVKATEGISV